MGEVYRATDSVLGRRVAIKLLAERHARDPDVRTRFKREALAAAQLSTQRHVVTVFDVGEHGGRPFIVMEYLDGGSVYDRLRTGHVSPERALTWLAESAEALDAAHARGIVHRDVKPANLLLDHAASVHVTDFGIASAAGLDTITLPGTVLGTAGYMAPEQARGEAATAASDRYALGIVAFELLTGRRPFAADTPVTEAFAHLNADVPSATRVRPGLPESVDPVFRHALAKDPDDRPASSKALVTELRAAFDAARVPARTRPAAPVQSAPASPPRRYEPRRNRLAAYGVVVLALLVAILVAAALVAAVGDDGAPQRAAERGDGSAQEGSGGAETRGDAAAAQPPPPAPPPAPDAAELNDAGFSYMQAGDFATALPLLDRSVSALAGSGELVEAWASYNLAFTRFALGQCDGVLDLLDRSEAVQGSRRDIDRLRRDVERICGASSGSGKGKGKKDKGRGGDDGDDD
jgi:serine/threonine-protein kinase